MTNQEEKFPMTDKKKTLLTACAAGVATFVVYLSALRNVFVEWDDKLYITSNPYIKSLDPTFFKWAFTTFYASNWHPLTWISHAFDYALWDLNPVGHILTNIIFHSLNAAILVLLIRSMMKIYGERTGSGAASIIAGQRTLIVAGFTGLLFGLHPLHVESAAWVAERKDVLSAFFFLLSLSAYSRYVGRSDALWPPQEERPQGVVSPQKGAAHRTMVERGPRFFNAWYLLALSSFILALMSKPMAVSLPCVLLILDWGVFSRIRSFDTFRDAFTEKLPFILCSLISSIVTIFAQKTGGAVVPFDWTPLSTRLLVAAHSLIGYLWKMVFPFNLVPYYPYPGNDISPFSPEYVFAVLMVAGITVIAVITVKRQKIWAAVCMYYLVTLLPVLGIVQAGGQSMADRYTYLPSVGPFILAGLAAAWVLKRTETDLNRWAAMRRLSPVIAVLLFLFLSYMTYRQIGVWKNEFTLWNYVVEKEPERNWLAYFNRGLAFFHKGEFRSAIPDFEKSLTLKAFSPESYFNMAGAYLNLGDLDKAIENYDKAISQNPSYYEAFMLRGQVHENKGELSNAVDDFGKTIALNPSNYLPYFLRGQIYDKAGRLDNAIEDFNRIVSLLPSNYVAYGNLGVVYAEAGKFSDAIAAFDKAVALNPLYSAAYMNRGRAYSLMGDYDKGLHDLNNAIALNQNYAGAYANRGDLYLSKGKKELALKDFQRACDLGNEGACKRLKNSPKLKTNQ